jgi:DNA-binding IscR family transcriptional regulator
VYKFFKIHQDIIHAIEGTVSLFDSSLNHGPECLIQKEMVLAEEKTEEHLRKQKMSELAKK